MILTLGLLVIEMIGLFLLLWSAVALVQKRIFFSSAPKEVLEVIQPKQPRFRGQHLLGWCVMVFAFVMLVGPIIFGGLDGIRRGFTFPQFLVRFLIQIFGLKIYDIFFFDWILLCNSNFFPHYYPEAKSLVGRHLLGFNKKSHVREGLFLIVMSFVLALVCAHIAA